MTLRWTFPLAGDTVYADDAHSREEYDACYAYNLSTLGFQAIMEGAPGIFSWDDHEIANNWTRDAISEARLEAATSAYFENLAIAPIEGSPRRLWRSFRFGQTVELFVLDCRGERIPEIGQYISPEQMAWLKAGLEQSTATWKIIHNSVPITQMPAVYQVPVMREDRWDGFPEQRDELLDHITANGLTGILFVSGDLHQSLFRDSKPKTAKPHFEICAGPSGPT